jgi:hypothetical protein
MCLFFSCLLFLLLFLYLIVNSLTRISSKHAGALTALRELLDAEIAAFGVREGEAERVGVFVRMDTRSPKVCRLRFRIRFRIRFVIVSVHFYFVRVVYIFCVMLLIFFLHLQDAALNSPKVYEELAKEIAVRPHTDVHSQDCVNADVIGKNKQTFCLP